MDPTHNSCQKKTKVETATEYGMRFFSIEIPPCPACKIKGVLDNDYEGEEELAKLRIPIKCKNKECPVINYKFKVDFKDEEKGPEIADTPYRITIIIPGCPLCQYIGELSENNEVKDCLPHLFFDVECETDECSVHTYTFKTDFN